MGTDRAIVAGMVIAAGAAVALSPQLAPLPSGNGMSEQTVPSAMALPAIEQAAADGIRVSGPFGVDTMFHKTGVDAFIVMLHDQGHIAAKLLARDATAALTIGSPILFSSVAHGSAHDIAGKGVANPKAMIEALLRLSTAGQRSERRGAPPIAH